MMSLASQDTAERLALDVRQLGKTYPNGHRVFQDLSFALKPKDRLALLGRNGQGKSTLIKMLGGALMPTEGVINWGCTASWPIGFGGGFQGSLSGYDNIRFLARLYNRDIGETLHRVDSFAELGEKLKVPVRHYSSGMRARLAFGLSLAIEFDCYLIDELVAVGDSRFQRKCQVELFERRQERTFIIASHDMHLITSLCDRALIIESGKAKMFDDIEEAVDVYSWLRAA
ncbi:MULTISPECIES: ABC transporter ATP-binding protein [unclassified Brevundimonas]|uniref:ABC transporter ATP-binding protein n=1 Tax=unclassified Brevundimonas TaxID=2622653 RepID=UPI0025C5E13F|nr:MULTISPECIES: ABC transporter ATP-binding protein [unclassified Brevundimonas]